MTDGPGAAEAPGAVDLEGPKKPLALRGRLHVVVVLGGSAGRVLGPERSRCWGVQATQCSRGLSAGAPTRTRSCMRARPHDRHHTCAHTHAHNADAEHAQKHTYCTHARAHTQTHTHTLTRTHALVRAHTHTDTNRLVAEQCYSLRVLPLTRCRRARRSCRWWAESCMYKSAASSRVQGRCLLVSGLSNMGTKPPSSASGSDAGPVSIQPTSPAGRAPRQQPPAQSEAALPRARPAAPAPGRPRRHTPPPRPAAPAPGPTCTMLGCSMAVLMAVSMTSMRSRFSAPLMRAGRIMVFTATVVPRQRPAADGGGALGVKLHSQTSPVKPPRSNHGEGGSDRNSDTRSC